MALDYFTTLTNAGAPETLEFNVTIGTRLEAAMTVCVFLNRRDR